MITLAERTKRIMQILEHTKGAVLTASKLPSSSNAWLDAVLCEEALHEAILEWKHCPEFPARRK